MLSLILILLCTAQAQDTPSEEGSATENDSQLEAKDESQESEPSEPEEDPELLRARIPTTI